MSAIKKFFGKKKGNKTFKCHKKVPKGSRAYNLLLQKKDTLKSNDFAESVKLPSGTELDDWLAANIVDFYNEIIMTTEDVIKKCTPMNCPKMCAGEKYQYLWQDPNDSQYLTPTVLPAHEYITLLYQWIDNLLEDESIFPPDPVVPFPSNFKEIASQIFRREFRVYAHIYYSHQQDLKDLDLVAPFNTAFQHFYAFIKEFKLVPSKELEPLHDIIVALKK